MQSRASVVFVALSFINSQKSCSRSAQMAATTSGTAALASSMNGRALASSYSPW